MITEELKNKNFTTFKRYLNSLVNEESTNKIIELVGGESVLANASFGMTNDTGSAYDGSLIQNALKIAELAVNLNDLLPEELKVEKSSIYKVALLQHISKCVMYVKNTNKWEIDNRGLIYKFAENGVSLKGGERSLLISLNAYITFTDQEFEAMRIIDKLKETDDASRWYACPLATIIRQANELVTLINKNSK